MQVAVPLSSLGDRGRSYLVGLMSLWCFESPPDTACTATEREASQAYAFPSVWAMFFLIHVHDFPLSAADLTPMPIFQAVTLLVSAPAHQLIP